MRRIEIELGGMFVENPEGYLPGVIGSAVLLDDLAPKTCEALWQQLPITSRTIHTYALGQAWRTETNHKLLPEASENIATEQTPFHPGDVLYFLPGPLFKVGMIYGTSRIVPTKISVIARVDDNLEGLINASRRILYQGPLSVTFRRR
jgi:hypothetical protein